MPEGDGADFYRAAVAQRKELAQHFLFMTGDTANEEAWRVLEGTRAPVLAKPFHAVEQVSA
jgi:DNA-binding response OmpR family regulator